jgi:hypothetical protein
MHNNNQTGGASSSSTTKTSQNKSSNAEDDNFSKFDVDTMLDASNYANLKVIISLPKSLSHTHTYSKL